MKFSIITLGCKVNAYESQYYAGQLEELGYEQVSPDQACDICIINTCTVTNTAASKSRQKIHYAKRMNPNALCVVVGCFVQFASEDERKALDADLVIGAKQKNELVNLIQKALKDHEKIDVVNEVTQFKDFEAMPVHCFESMHRAFLKVQDGCNQFCSYCIIPYARGRVRSRKIDSIIKEIEQIAQKGIKEVVITGIHLASYGKDFEENIGLIDLLEEINKVDGIVRIRLGSLEPKIITEEFMQRLIKLEKICHHFHLSLQSGCDNTLKRMNRKYTTSEFEEIVQRLRKYYNDVILTTDIIVGFPGETEEDFETTYNYLKKINFYKMHVFPYSPRKGTVAAKMPDQIQGDVKEKRSKKLIELSNENQKQYNQNLIGKDVEVLFEEKNKEGYYKGHTQNYILVEYKTDEELENKIVKVNIKKAEVEYVIG